MTFLSGGLQESQVCLGPKHTHTTDALQSGCLALPAHMLAFEDCWVQWAGVEAPPISTG